MIKKFQARYLRISPIKARRVIAKVRGKDTQEAMALLSLMPNKPARMILSLIKSAVAAFKQINEDIKESSLLIKEAYVDEGPRFKRILPRAFGRANIIKKRTSHITVVVEG